MAIGDSFDGIDLFGDEVRQEIKWRVQAAARAAFDTATLLTPVDRGYLLNSWALTLDAPMYIDAESAGPGFIDDLRKITAETVVYITNGKAYAEYINDGTSKIPANNMLLHATTAAMDELDI